MRLCSSQRKTIKTNIKSLKMKIIIQDKLLFPEILKPRKKTAHKKICGRVLVVAGSLGMTGAAALVCKAAFRAGAGVVTLAFPKSLDEIYKKIFIETMTLPCPETKDRTMSKKAFRLIMRKSKDFDIIAVGPGLSRNKDTAFLIRKLLKKLKKPVVLDADGLHALASNMRILEKRKAPTIITPHPGEMADLLKTKPEKILEERKKFIPLFSKRYKVVTVLKGHETIVVDSEGRIVINKVGGPELATAGTGDVLVGIISAFWAANIKKPFESACTGVFIQGLSGQKAKEELGTYSVIASDLIEFLPNILRKFSNGKI